MDRLFERRDEYQVFAKEFDEVRDLLELLAYGASSKMDVAHIKSKSYFLSTLTLMSVLNSLECIKDCVCAGHISDAYTLLRKSRDDLFQYLFITRARIKAAESISSASTNCSISELDEDSFYQFVLDVWDAMLNHSKSEEESAIDAWITGELQNNSFKGIRNHYFETSKYIGFLTTDSITATCVKRFFNDRLIALSRLLNNYVHANSIDRQRDNLPQYVTAHLSEHCTKLNDSLKLISSVFLSCITLITPDILMSDDYIASLELGIHPSDGEQYFIMSGIQGFMEKHFSSIDPDLQRYLNDNNRYGMRIL